MKKMLCAAAAAFLLSAGGAAFAADGPAGYGTGHPERPAAESAPSAVPVEEAESVLQKSTEAFWKAFEGSASGKGMAGLPEELMTDSALPKTVLSDTVRYVPYRAADTGKALPIGQLQIERDGVVSTMTVFNMLIDRSKLERDIPKFLFTEGYSIERRKTEMGINWGLVNSEKEINAFLQQLIEAARKKWNEPIPDGIVSIYEDYGDRFDPMDGVKAYSVALLVSVRADGWLLPCYIRAYLYPEGEECRLVVVIADGDEWRPADIAGKLLIKKFAPKKK